MPKRKKLKAEVTKKHCSKCGKAGVYVRTHRPKSKGGHVG